MSISTIVEPIGVPTIIEISIPKTEQITDKMAEPITTHLKLLKIRIVDKAGNIMSAEVRSEPTSFIVKTIIMAMIIAIIKL